MTTGERNRVVAVARLGHATERGTAGAILATSESQTSELKTGAAMSDSLNSHTLAELDPDIAKVLDDELNRQRATLEMIASENFVPRAVLQAQGSVLTNKYAEGYPGRRYYGGCEAVDVAESLAIERAKKVFGADFVNVQPHSGAQANAADNKFWTGYTSFILCFFTSDINIKTIPQTSCSGYSGMKIIVHRL